MEASAHPHQPAAPPSLRSVPARELVVEGPGLARLSLMVGTVFERLIAAPATGRAGRSG